MWTVIIGLLLGLSLLFIVIYYWNRFSSLLEPKPDATTQMERKLAYQEYCEVVRELNQPMMKEGQQSHIMEPNTIKLDEPRLE